VVDFAGFLGTFGVFGWFCILGILLLICGYFTCFWWFEFLALFGVGIICVLVVFVICDRFVIGYNRFLECGFGVFAGFFRGNFGNLCGLPDF